MIRIPHLETDITRACQLSCVACNHAVPLWRHIAGGPWYARPEQVERDLGRLATMVHADVWGALGGEPLLRGAGPLLEILDIVRKSRVADRIELWTNGLMMHGLPEALWRAFDTLVVSVYPGKHSPENLQYIRDRCQDHGRKLVINDEVNYPNFRTWLAQRETGAVDTAEKFRHCFFRGYSRSVNQGYFHICCCAPSISVFIQKRSFGRDGLLIETLTEKELAVYLDRSEPLLACKACAGRDTAIPIRWSEERDPERWLVASSGGGEE